MTRSERPGADGPARRMPEVVIIGAMKCGTTALHRYLDHHPDIAMAEPKELNFFFGDPRPVGESDGERECPEADWVRGNWRLGEAWYVGRFDPHARVRGEASPGYTSPDHPEVAGRMARSVPEVRLVYLVRDPLERALSQYRHHRDEGSESRPVMTALMDPESQYIARSRYHERLLPFVERFPREQIMVIEHGELLDDRRATLSRLFGVLGVDPDFWTSALRQRWHVGRRPAPALPPGLRQRFGEAVADDVERLRTFTGQDLVRWSVHGA